jgi:hypothetical protein
MMQGGEVQQVDYANENFFYSVEDIVAVEDQQCGNMLEILRFLYILFQELLHLIL